MSQPSAAALQTLRQFLQHIPTIEEAGANKVGIDEDDIGAVHVTNPSGVTLVLLSKEAYEALRSNGA